jgi:hypothetical protein
LLQGQQLDDAATSVTVGAIKDAAGLLDDS